MIFGLIPEKSIRNHSKFVQKLHTINRLLSSFCPDRQEESEINPQNPEFSTQLYQKLFSGKVQVGIRPILSGFCPRLKV